MRAHSEPKKMVLLSIGLSGAFSLVAGLVFGISGFGDAIIFQILWASFAFLGDDVGNLSRSLAILTLGECCSNSFMTVQTWVLRTRVSFITNSGLSQISPLPL